MPDLRHLLKKSLAALRLLEEGFLCLLLVTMIGVAVLQIVLRSFFSGGLLWADPFLRYLVLWSGMFGAALATKRGKHIALDVVTFVVPERLVPWLRSLLDIFSALVAMVLTWAAITFVKNEAAFGVSVLLGIPGWCWNLVFPLAFALIALRFLGAGVSDFLVLAGKRQQKRLRPGLGR